MDGRKHVEETDGKMGSTSKVDEMEKDRVMEVEKEGGSEKMLEEEKDGMMN